MLIGDSQSDQRDAREVRGVGGDPFGQTSPAGVFCPVSGHRAMEAIDPVLKATDECPVIRLPVLTQGGEMTAPAEGCGPVRLAHPCRLANIQSLLYRLGVVRPSGSISCDLGVVRPSYCRNDSMILRGGSLCPRVALPAR